MRLIDWLMICAVIIVALAGKIIDFDGQPSDPENPRRPSPEAFEPKFWDAETRNWLAQTPHGTGTENPAFARLPAAGIIQEDTVRNSSSGSAFSISETGKWLTARHVVWGCDRILIQTGERQALSVTDVTFHPQADIALLSTRGAPAPFVFSTATNVAANAFGVGFPKGQPGAVHGAYLGDMIMQHRGRNGYRERVNAWSERSRIPNRTGSLGGLSGGVLLDTNGQIIGIIQAESRRRGRFMTAQLVTIKSFLKTHDTNYNTGPDAKNDRVLTSQFYPQTARELITTLRVAKVFCIVK